MASTKQQSDGLGRGRLSQHVMPTAPVRRPKAYSTTSAPVRRPKAYSTTSREAFVLGCHASAEYAATMPSAAPVVNRSPSAVARRHLLKAPTRSFSDVLWSPRAAARGYGSGYSLPNDALDSDEHMAAWLHATGTAASVPSLPPRHRHSLPARPTSAQQHGVAAGDSFRRSESAGMLRPPPALPPPASEPAADVPSPASASATRSGPPPPSIPPSDQQYTLRALRQLDVYISPSNRFKAAAVAILAMERLHDLIARLKQEDETAAERSAAFGSINRPATAAERAAAAPAAERAGDVLAPAPAAVAQQPAPAAAALPAVRAAPASRLARRCAPTLSTFAIDRKASTSRLVVAEAARLREDRAYVELEFEMNTAGADKYSDAEREAARAFDCRHLARTSTAEAQLAKLKSDPTYLVTQERLRHDTHLVRINKYVKPESYDPFAPPPKLHKRVAKRPEKGRRQWTLDQSVWVPRQTVALARDYFETPAALARVLHADWNMALLHRALADFIVKVDGKHVRDANERSIDAPEVEAVKGVILRHARAIYGAFDHYSLIGHLGEHGVGLRDDAGRKITSYVEAVAKLDVHSIVKGAFNKFVKDCDLEGGMLSQSNLLSTWATVNAESIEAKHKDVHNSKMTLNRHEWLQILVRLAVNKYCHFDPVVGCPRGSPSEALDKLCYTHLHGQLPRAAMQNGNIFRKLHLYNEGTDAVIKERLPSLQSLFHTYANVDWAERCATNIALAEKHRMSAGEWMLLVHDAGLLEMDLVDNMSALQAFLWSRIRVIDNYSDASEIGLRQMSFEDFLEGLVRLATVMALPTRQEIEEAQAFDAAELMHCLRVHSPVQYQEHVTRRTLKWDDGPRQRAHILLDHLLVLIIHNVEACAIVASHAERKANGLSKGDVTIPRKLALVDKPLTDAMVSRFRKHRADGGKLEHGRIAIHAEEVSAAMMRVESHIMHALRQVPAFDVLSPEEISMLRRKLSVAKFDDRVRVFNQGDESDEKFYLITTGSCDVLRFDPACASGERGGEMVVGRLHQSDCFGERALLTNEPRAASIRAGPGCKLYVVFIRKSEFEEVLGKPLTEFKRLRTEGTPPAAADLAGYMGVESAVL